MTVRFVEKYIISTLKSETKETFTGNVGNE